MVKTILALLAASIVTLLEVGGAVCVVVGLGLMWGAPAVLISTGAAALLKSFELDIGGKS